MIKRAIIITLILNSFIMIGVPAGHGYGIMVMFEFISIPSLIRNGFNLSNDFPFNSLMLFGLISLIGKVVLIISLFYRNISDQKVLIYGGLGLILTAFNRAIYGAWENDAFLFAVTLGSGIPFLMYIGRVIYLMERKNKRTVLEAD